MFTVMSIYIYICIYTHITYALYIIIYIYTCNHMYNPMYGPAWQYIVATQIHPLLVTMFATGPASSPMTTCNSAWI